MPQSAVAAIGIRGKSFEDTPNGKREDAFEVAMGLTFEDGTGNQKINNVWHDERTLAASGSESIDLAGTLTNRFGQAVTFTRVRGIIVRADPANTNDVVIGGAPSNGFVGPFGAAAHTVQVRPGDIFAITNQNLGWLVTAGTGDLLRILNSGAGTSVKYKILLMGE